MRCQINNNERSVHNLYAFRKDSHYAINISHKTIHIYPPFSEISLKFVLKCKNSLTESYLFDYQCKKTVLFSYKTRTKSSALVLSCIFREKVRKVRNRAKRVQTKHFEYQLIKWIKIHFARLHDFFSKINKGIFTALKKIKKRILLYAGFRFFAQMHTNS